MPFFHAVGVQSLSVRFYRKLSTSARPYCLDDLVAHEIIVSSTAQVFVPNKLADKDLNTIGSIFIHYWISAIELMEGCM
jgi:hypothetical protein